MALGTLVWKLASPYDAYISHVAQLEDAIDRIRFMADMVQGFEAGLSGSVRYVPGGEEAERRAQRFRERLGSAAAQMSDEEFEDFLSHLGGGTVADVEADRARTVSKLGATARGVEEYFAIAGQELAVLEKRGYTPRRGDVARQLRENDLPSRTIADYRHMLHELGIRVGKAPV